LCLDICYVERPYQTPSVYLLSQLFEELKRRNVFRVGLAYLAVAWLLLQAADIVLDNIAAPVWLMQAIMLFIIIGFPIALIFAWAFEMTPDGIKKEAEVDRSSSITDRTGKKLDRIIIAVLSVAVVSLLVDRFMMSDGPTTSVITEKSVAVLPFVAMSRGPDDEYFADGLTEEILNSLTRLPQLLVTARTSAFHFKGQDIPIPDIAAALGVAHVVEGSVRRDGGRLRVTAQLIRARDGFHVWSESYDRGADDTFGVQTDIAEKIATALDIVMDDDQREQMHAAGIRNPEAFIAYQKGVEIFNLSHGSSDMLGGLLTANDWLEEALALEPNLSSAYLAHSDYFTHFLMDNVSNDEVSAEQMDATFLQLESDLENAIRTSPDEGSRLAAAFDLAIVSGRWRRLPALFDQIVVEGGCAHASWLDMTSLSFGKAEEMLALEQSQIDCDPMRFSGWSGASFAHMYLGDAEEAIATSEKALTVIQHVRIYQALILAYVAAGRFEEAENVAKRNIQRERTARNTAQLIAAARGDKDEAISILKEMTTVYADSNRHPLNSIAVAGERERANAMAADLDSHRFGHMVLMLHATICRCGAPWELEVTPNFAQLIEDANLSWPPDSPIEWPLKDW
jgi:adenylate cyclase